ncbi:MAG: hypothetical protein HLUCCO16_08180 [Phormidium sp. OSCR]|nr:MAG: hypothetical protein HLUCCO16_08180 [Phormidium sp. OSCR]
MGSEKLRASSDEVAIIADQMGQLEIPTQETNLPNLHLRVKSPVFDLGFDAVEFHSVESVYSPPLVLFPEFQVAAIARSPLNPFPCTWVGQFSKQTLVRKALCVR